MNAHEEFRQDMIRWLQEQDRNGDFSDQDMAAQGLPPLTFTAGVQIATTWVRDEITKDMQEGKVPECVCSFSELHDYVDANGYGGAFAWPCLPSEDRTGAYQEEFTRFWNAVQGNVDAWLQAGRPE